MNKPEQFEQWALLELMGRQRIAGLVTERTIAGAGFLEVSVPETKNNPKFTRFISPGSIYAINPIDEATARMYAENLQVKPIDSWDISAFMRKVEEQKMLASVTEEEEEGMLASLTEEEEERMLASLTEEEEENERDADD